MFVRSRSGNKEKIFVAFPFFSQFDVETTQQQEEGGGGGGTQSCHQLQYVHGHASIAELHESGRHDY